MQRVRECLAELFHEIELRHLQEGHGSETWLAGLRAVARSAAQDALGVDRNPAEYGSLAMAAEAPSQIHVFAKNGSWHLLITVPKAAPGEAKRQLIEITAPGFGYSNRLGDKDVMLGCAEELGRLVKDE